MMYMIETPENGFTSIPRSIYWAIVTLTTVGYGDITPQSVAGQSLASVIMVIGYAIIAVPTGIVTSEIIRSDKAKIKTNTQSCSIVISMNTTMMLFIVKSVELNYNLPLN